MPRSQSAVMGKICGEGRTHTLYFTETNVVAHRGKRHSLRMVAAAVHEHIHKGAVVMGIEFVQHRLFIGIQRNFVITFRHSFTMAYPAGVAYLGSKPISGGVTHVTGPEGPPEIFVNGIAVTVIFYSDDCNSLSN